MGEDSRGSREDRTGGESAPEKSTRIGSFPETKETDVFAAEYSIWNIVYCSNSSSSNTIYTQLPIPKKHFFKIL